MKNNPFTKKKKSPKKAGGGTATNAKPKATRAKRNSATRGGAAKTSAGGGARKPKRTFRSLVKTMELMREACTPYHWSRKTWKLMVGENFLLDPRAGDPADVVTYRDELDRTVTGLVYVTTFQLRFYPSRHVKMPASFFRVPLATIAQITVVDDNGPSASASSTAQIILHCKDFRKLRFQARRGKVIKLAELLKAFVFPSKIDFTFAFQAEVELQKLRKKHQKEGSEARVLKKVEQFRGKGPRYDFYEEFTRCGALNGKGLGDNSQWRVCQLNQAYDFSPTYPALHIMPAQFSDAELRSLGGFRSKSRIPSMSWCMPGTGGKGPTLWRCSQPKVGMQGKRNGYDEKLMKDIIINNKEFVRKTGQTAMLIGDARPQLNAYTNKVGGWGYEEPNVYNFVELRFLNIDNIHKVRGSLSKLADVAMNGRLSDSELTNWYKTLEDTKWLFLVRTLLYGAIKCAYEMLKNRRSCIVHCSDGWDRTAQLSALIQLMLDPFARTIDGFCIVVQKDWLSFGHQFQKRIGHADSTHDDPQRSPVFIQFLDAVWQFLNQYPEAFEFNSGLLLLLADELYACRFGTFLFNTEAQRKRASLDRKTLSIWDYVEEHRLRYRNPRYLADQGPLLPNSQLCLKNVEIWRDLHLRWGPQPSILSWNFFETKKSPPPYAWPSPDQVAEAHAKRRAQDVVVAKTAPLERKVQRLQALLKKAREELAAMKKAQGETSADAAVDIADEEGEEDAPLESKEEVEVNEPESAATSPRGEDEDWAALAENGGTMPAVGQEQEQQALKAAVRGAVVAAGKAVLSRELSAPEIDEADMDAVEEAVEAAIEKQQQERDQNTKAAPESEVEAAVEAEAAAETGVVVDDNAESSEGEGGIEVEGDSEEDPDVMDML